MDKKQMHSLQNKVFLGLWLAVLICGYVIPSERYVQYLGLRQEKMDTASNKNSVWEGVDSKEALTSLDFLRN